MPSPQPTAEDLDIEIRTKLSAMIARQWDDPAPFVQLANAYAAMRQVEMLAAIINKLTGIRTEIDRHGDTLVALATEMPDDEEETNGSRETIPEN